MGIAFMAPAQEQSRAQASLGMCGRSAQDPASWWPLAWSGPPSCAQRLWVLHGLLSSHWTEAHSVISGLGAACEAQDLGASFPGLFLMLQEQPGLEEVRAPCPAR